MCQWKLYKISLGFNKGCWSIGCIVELKVVVHYEWMVYLGKKPGF